MIEAYLFVFVIVVIAYVIYSAWTRLDSRFLIVAVVVIPTIAAIEYGLGRTGQASSLADYFFIVLGGFIALLVIDDLRGDRESKAREFASESLAHRHGTFVPPSGSGALGHEPDELE